MARLDYIRINPDFLYDLTEIRQDVEEYLDQTLVYLALDENVVTLETQDELTAQQQTVIQQIINDASFIEPSDKREYTIKAGKNTNVQNVFLEDEFQNHTNVNSDIIPCDSKIWALTASSSDDEAWDLELYVNSSLIQSFSINSSTNSTNSFNFSVDVNLGDKISLYCKSMTFISRPKCTVYLQSIRTP